MVGYHVNVSQGHRVRDMAGLYYFSTHGCKRLDSCLLVGAFDELAWAAACCRAFRLKKSAMVSSGGCRKCCGDDDEFKVERGRDASSR